MIGPRLDRVSTTCGSGWVRSCAAADLLNTGVRAAHPPATAGGTDSVQRGFRTSRQSRPPSRSRLFTLGAFQYVYVMMVILIIGPFTVAALYSQDFFDAYVRTVLAPRLRRKFGFTLEVRRMYYRKRHPLGVFVITNLKPNGEFARLGVRNCDVPVGGFHMTDAELYRALKRSEHTKVEIRFINCDEYAGELDSGDLILAPHERKLSPATNRERFRSSTFCRGNDGLLRKSLCDFSRYSCP
jgi:hypothetical protein